MATEAFYRYCRQQEYREPVGDRLTEILAELPESLGIVQKVCGCKPMQHRMNMLGVAWCREHRAEIVAHLVKQSKATSDELPFGLSLSDLLGDMLDEAIRLTESQELTARQ